MKLEVKNGHILLRGLMWENSGGFVLDGPKDMIVSRAEIKTVSFKSNKKYKIEIDDTWKTVVSEVFEIKIGDTYYFMERGDVTLDDFLSIL